MSKSPMEVYEAFGAGLAAGGSDWKELVTDDMTFEGPANRVEGVEAFAELNAQFLSLLRGHRLHRAIEHSEGVVAEVSFDLATPRGNTITLNMTEWYDIEDGAIKAIKVYYDAEEYRREFATGT